MPSPARVALVTGSSKGIGRGIAIGLAHAGWDVFVNYCGDREGAEETSQRIGQLGRRCWILQGDVGYSDQVDAIFQQVQEQAGQLDLLVNNAGVQTWSSLLELREEDFDRTIRTNLKGTFLCMQRAGRMMQNRGGVIINIGSGANKRPFPKLVDYGASKGGIERLTKVAAVELGPLGIRVNLVAPGAIEIERTRDEAPNYRETWGPITPMRRVGKVEDVAAAVVFLASEPAEFITGQVLYVDGGVFTQGVWPYDQESS
jgi:NAD(P)-dependent dehydrogenase (short-subunit alcohol dehydrogenase family)